MTSRIFKLTFIIGLLALLTVWSGSPAMAQTRDSDASTTFFGLVGITFGQTAQLNVVYSDPPDPGIPVLVEMAFFDSDGNVLARSVETLLPGKSASLRVNGSTFTRFGSRLLLRAVVKAGVSPEPFGVSPTPFRDATISTFEVVENALQRTLFLNPAVLKGFNPQPDPPGTTAEQ
jgi:hypothetical protein